MKLFCKVFLFLSLLGLVMVVPLHAQDVVWGGTTSTDWLDATNWVGGVGPTATDNAWINTVAGGILIPHSFWTGVLSPGCISA